jgi:SAM-dependent methyltransferase
LIEIGCGTGLNLPPLRKAAPKSTTILGLDWTAAMLQKCRARGEGVQLLQADPAAIKPGTADVVLLAYVLAVTPDWQQVLQQAQQLLRPGGALVILDTGRWQGSWRWCNPLFGPLVSWSGHADLDCPWREALPAKSTMEAIYCGGMVQLWAGEFG